MLSHWLTQLSDRNPQLLREIKGRVTRRNMLVTLALSLVTQLLIAGYYGFPSDSAYAETSARQIMMWRHWWFDIFNTTTWLALLLLLFLGSYLLVEDIAKEERRGTLAFVRLSPESAQSILLGKLLGVPILLYAAIALAVPLHFWAAVNAGLSLLTIANVYALIATSCSFVYAFATFHALGWGAKAQIFYILPIPCFIYFLLWLFSFYGRYFDLHENVPQDSVFIASFEPCFFFSFLLTTFAVLSFGLWSGCIHRFHLPPLRR